MIGGNLYMASSTTGLSSTALAQHASLSVRTFQCSSPVAGLHDALSISYVRSGSLSYHARGKSFDLIPGSILLGRPAVEYVCTHDCGGRGECISFRFAPALLDTIGESSAAWAIGCLPPTAELMVLGELAQSAADGTSDVGLDEVGILLAARLA